MIQQSETSDKIGLLFTVLRQVGLYAQTQLTDRPLPLDDPWTFAQANNSLDATALQSLGPSADKSVWDRCIRLPHFAKDSTNWVPLLWVQYRGPGEVALQVVVAGGRRMFGYRWEPPEGGASGISKHDFYHVQPLTSVRKPGGGGVVELNRDHNDVCEHFPTFPIDARDGLDLVDALFVSLYGPTYTDYIHEAEIRKAVHESSASRGWARCRNQQASPAKSTGAASAHASKKKR